MSFKFHCVVKDATNADELGRKDSVEQEMSGAMYYAGFVTGTVPAVA